MRTYAYPAPIGAVSRSDIGRDGMLALEPVPAAEGSVAYRACTMGGMWTADRGVFHTSAHERPRGAVRVRTRAAALGVGACLAVAIALTTAPGAGAAKGDKRSGACPKQADRALPLGDGAIKKARKAALVAAPSLYKGLDVDGAQAVSAKVATSAGPRGGEVAYQCGKAVQARTIVVELRFPKELPSASLSEGVVFVSRFESGYEVWEVAH